MAGATAPSHTHTHTVRARVVGWGVGGYGPAGQSAEATSCAGGGVWSRRQGRDPTIPYPLKTSNLGVVRFLLKKKSSG